MKKGRLKPKIGFQTTFKLYLQTDSLHLLFRRVDGVLVGIDQNLDAAVLGAAFGCGVRCNRMARAVAGGGRQVRDFGTAVR